MIVVWISSKGSMGFLFVRLLQRCVRFPRSLKYLNALVISTSHLRVTNCSYQFSPLSPIVLYQNTTMTQKMIARPLEGKLAIVTGAFRGKLEILDFSCCI